MARRPRPIEVKNIQGIRALTNQSLSIARDRLATIHAMQYTNREVILNLEAVISGLETTLEYIDGLAQSVGRDITLS